MNERGKRVVLEALESRRLLSGTVVVQVFADANANGVRDAGETSGAGTVYLDRGKASEMKLFADASGVATFNNVPSGTHNIYLFPAYQHIWTAGRTEPFVNVADNLTTSVSVGHAPATLLGRVYGFVFEDKNQNAKHDTGENYLLPNCAVYVDANGNDALDRGEQSFTTNVDGYSLYMLPGTYTIRHQVNNGWQQSLPASNGEFTVTLTAGNMVRKDFGVSPLPRMYADPGGPYYVPEGGSVLLNGESSLPFAGHTLVDYEWDLNYDGTTFDVDATGVKPMYYAGTRDSANSGTVGLRVRDEIGQVSWVEKTMIWVQNVAPVALFKSGGAVTLGQNGAVSFSLQSDPSAADTAAGFRYSYDLNNDGTYEVMGSTASSGVVPAAYLSTVGTHTVRAAILDKDGGHSEYTATITVNPKPVVPPPTAEAGGPYTVNEGGTVTLVGTGTPAAGRTIAAYEWDYDYVGGTFYVEATGKNLPFSPGDADGPSTRTIAFRVKDDQGNVSAIDTTTVQVKNAPPTAQLVCPASTTVGTAVKVYLQSLHDPALADNAAYFKFSYDWNDDGTWEMADNGWNNEMTPASFVATTGTKKLRVRVKDKDGGYNDYTATMVVLPKVGTDTTPPKATLLTALRLRQTGGSFYKFTVRYTDASGIDTGSVLSSNIQVTGPNGFISEVRLLSRTVVNSTTVDGFYRLAAPGGTWDSSDNGLYTINVIANQVHDWAGNYIPAGPTTMPKTRNGVPVPGVTVPGQFTVAIALSPALVKLPLFSIVQRWEKDKLLSHALD